MIQELLSTLKTNYWEVFSKADMKWNLWVINTYRKLWKENIFSKNVENLTELSLVLNWKCWEHYDNWNLEMSKLYEKLRFEIDTWCLDSFKWKDKDYYFRRTD